MSHGLSCQRVSRSAPTTYMAKFSPVRVKSINFTCSMFVAPVLVVPVCPNGLTRAAAAALKCVRSIPFVTDKFIAPACSARLKEIEQSVNLAELLPGFEKAVAPYVPPIAHIFGLACDLDSLCGLFARANFDHIAYPQIVRRIDVCVHFHFRCSDFSNRRCGTPYAGRQFAAHIRQCRNCAGPCPARCSVA